MQAQEWKLRFPNWQNFHPKVHILLYMRQIQKIYIFRKERKARIQEGEQIFQEAWDKAFWFAIFNGQSRGQEQFQNKYNFGNLVRRVGYRAPFSVIIPPNVSLNEYRSQIEALDVDDQRRFCKPLWGVFGRGAVLQATIQDTSTFIQQQIIEYLVQTYEEPIQDWRYVLHRDSNQVKLSQPPLWRLAIQKVRPVVIGDGVSTLNELYAAQTDIPILYRKRYMQTVGVREGTKIPKLYEKVVLLEAANMAQGAYPKVASGKVLETLDKFFLQFLEELEQEIGFSLGSFVVDIGITDISIFEGKYDHEKIKSSIVFYEFQLPCTLNIYSYSPELFKEYKETIDMHPLSPAKIMCILKKKLVHFEFFRSMMITGAALEKRNKRRK